MPELDPFFLFRRVLLIVCAVYSLVITVRGLRYWLNYLMADGRDRALLRRYLWLHALRMRWRRFAGELFKVAALSVLTLLAIWAHRFI